MNPKLTTEMQFAISQSHGRPVDVVDDQGRTFVLLPKDAFAHLDSLRTDAEKSSIDQVRKMIQDGIDSGPGIPMDEAIASLREYARQLGNPSE